MEKEKATVKAVEAVEVSDKPDIQSVKSEPVKKKNKNKFRISISSFIKKNINNEGFVLLNVNEAKANVSKAYGEIIAGSVFRASSKGKLSTLVRFAGIPKQAVIDEVRNKGYAIQRVKVLDDKQAASRGYRSEYVVGWGD